MNLRALLIRASLVAAFLVVAVAASVIAPRSGSETKPIRANAASTALLPLIALPLVHVLLTP